MFAALPCSTWMKKKMQLCITHCAVPQGIPTLWPGTSDVPNNGTFEFWSDGEALIPLF